MWEGIVRKFGEVMCTLLYSKWITKDLLYSTENSVQCYVATWMEGGLGENGYMYICMCRCICMAEQVYRNL